jgi:hypothetical protein
MDHHDFARRLAAGPLRFHQHPNIRLGLKEPALDGKAGFAAVAFPEMAGHGLPVRIAEQWIEGDHGNCSIGH